MTLDFLRKVSFEVQYCGLQKVKAELLLGLSGYFAQTLEFLLQGHWLQSLTTCCAIQKSKLFPQALLVITHNLHPAMHASSNQKPDGSSFG